MLADHTTQTLGSTETWKLDVASYSVGMEKSNVFHVTMTSDILLSMHELIKGIILESGFLTTLMAFLSRLCGAEKFHRITL